MSTAKLKLGITEGERAYLAERIVEERGNLSAVSRAAGITFCKLKRALMLDKSLLEAFHSVINLWKARDPAGEMRWLQAKYRQSDRMFVVPGDIPLAGRFDEHVMLGRSAAQQRANRRDGYFRSLWIPTEACPSGWSTSPPFYMPKPQARLCRICGDAILSKQSLCKPCARKQSAANRSVYRKYNRGRQPVSLKRCSACGNVKEARLFRPNHNSASGLSARCYDCQADRARSYKRRQFSSRGLNDAPK